MSNDITPTGVEREERVARIPREEQEAQQRALQERAERLARAFKQSTGQTVEVLSARLSDKTYLVLKTNGDEALMNHMREALIQFRGQIKNRRGDPDIGPEKLDFISGNQENVPDSRRTEVAPTDLVIVMPARFGVEDTIISGLEKYGRGIKDQVPSFSKNQEPPISADHLASLRLSPVQFAGSLPNGTSVSPSGASGPSTENYRA